jgi:MYXO-CTERM domain-containing protein
MKTRLLCSLALAATLATPAAWAEAKFTIVVVDTDGVGFNDPTPATPVAGNTGTTVGEQRLNVFQAAADAWGRILDSPVPIVVEASFAPLDCINGMAVEGQAAPYSVGNSSALPTKDEYPTALANKILGRDMFPDDPDITAQFNGALADCIGVDWYYGLDGNAGTKQANLLTTVMHELTHGLGFTDNVDPTTGAFALRATPLFALYMLDNKTGKHFAEMSNAERKTALTDVRGLVWDGQRTDAVTARFFSKGLPSLQIEPAPTGFSGFIGEANFGRLVADGPAISGSVAVGSIDSSCSSMTGSFSGKIALVTSLGNCASLSAASRVETAGGLAMLFAYDRSGSPPPVALEFRSSDIARFNVTIPTVSVTLDDDDLIQNASGATVTLSADNGRLVGADEAGHALLFASNPIQPGSTGPHWDPLVRPNLIMEPVDLPNPVMYLDMELAVLWDIGWTGDCGNGTVDSGEACDDGAANSDYFPDACRLDCTRARCGDGVVDSGEQCDPGGNGKLGNSNCDASCQLKSGGGTGGVSGTGGTGAGGSGAGGTSGKGGAGGSAPGSGGTSATGGTSGSGGSGPTGGDTGSGGAAGAGQGGSDNGSGGDDHPGSGGTAGGASGAGQGGTSSGCGCRIDRGDLQPGASLLVVVFGLLLWARRRAQPTRQARRRASRRP